MAENTLREVRDGETVTIDDINQTVRALKGNQVPRDDAGNAASGAGSLGTEEFPFSEVHALRYLMNGQPFEGGAGGAAAEAPIFQNGVISGASPTNRRGICGWMNQAGTAGVRINASAENPLVVRVGGQEYRLTTPIVGGSALPDVVAKPTNAVWRIQDETDTVRSFNDETGEASRGMSGYTLLFNGKPFKYTSNTGVEVPSTVGDLIIFKFLRPGFSGEGTEYLMFERDSSIAVAPSGRRCIRGAFNTSSTAYSFLNISLDIRTAAAEEQFDLVTPGYIFIDPTTDPWEINIQDRVLGSTAEALPETASPGQVIYRQTTQKWYNYEGAAWVEKEWVFLGIAAIEDDNGASSVSAVAGVRSEEALRALYLAAQQIHAPDGIWDRSRSAFYDHTVSGTNIVLNPPDTTEQEPLIEERSPSFFLSQRHELLKSRFQFDADDKSSIRIENGLRDADSASHTFCIWVDAYTRETFGDNSVPVIVSLAVGQAFLAHQHKNAVLIGSFSQRNAGETPRIPTGSFALTTTNAVSPVLWHESIDLVTPADGADNGVEIQGGVDAQNSQFLGNDGFIDDAIRTRDYSTAIGAFQSFELSRGSAATISFGLPTLGDIADSIDPA